jgi:uncharacterized NAD(P)/FAD-binding protein YdhS
MNPHIEATLKEIESRIANLQSLADGLRSSKEQAYRQFRETVSIPIEA